MITRYYPFALTLEAPLVLTGSDGGEALTFIPGSALRGAAARALCVRGFDRSNPDEFRRLILSGQVRYLNAYVVAQGRRCLPTPRSLRREKASGRVFDLACAPNLPPMDLAGLSEDYLTADGSDLVGGSVTTKSQTYLQRDRSSDSVISVEAVDAGQEFHGLLVVTGADEDSVSRDAATVRESLGTTILLGRSRRSEYGGAARLTWGSPRDREADGERLLVGDQPAGAVTRVLLTSDYLGRHPVTGQVDPTAFAIELRRRLGDRIEVQDRFQEFHRVGGFNRTWGLELPQGLALGAGAVLLLRLTQPVPWVELLAVENSGLGERRAEGLGRFLFLSAAEVEPTLRAATVAEIQPPATTPPPLLQTLQRRLLEEAVEHRLVEVAANLAVTARDVPSSRFLNQLRKPLRRPPREALDDLLQCLEALRLPIRQALQQCHWTEPSRTLESWFTDMAGGQTDLAALLGYDDLARRYHFATIESARGTLDNPGFATRTRLRLIEAVLVALARRSAT